jgi:hypothetical protein
MMQQLASLKESEAAKKRVAKRAGRPDLRDAPRAAMPANVRPMRATLVDWAFDHAGWIFPQDQFSVSQRHSSPARAEFPRIILLPEINCRKFFRIYKNSSQTLHLSEYIHASRDPVRRNADEFQMHAIQRCQVLNA